MSANKRRACFTPRAFQEHSIKSSPPSEQWHSTGGGWGETYTFYSSLVMCNSFHSPGKYKGLLVNAFNSALAVIILPNVFFPPRSFPFVVYLQMTIQGLGIFSPHFMLVLFMPYSFFIHLPMESV